MPKLSSERASKDRMQGRAHGGGQGMMQGAPAPGHFRWTTAGRLHARWRYQIHVAWWQAGKGESGALRTLHSLVTISKTEVSCPKTPM